MSNPHPQAMTLTSVIGQMTYDQLECPMGRELNVGFITTSPKEK